MSAASFRLMVKGDHPPIRARPNPQEHERDARRRLWQWQARGGEGRKIIYVSALAGHRGVVVRLEPRFPPSFTSTFLARHPCICPLLHSATGSVEPPPPLFLTFGRLGPAPTCLWPDRPLASLIHSGMTRALDWGSWGVVAGTLAKPNAPALASYNVRLCACGHADTKRGS